MSSCCCSLAGTAACLTCTENPDAETPPTVRTHTVAATDTILLTGQKTHANRIRAMSDEELAEWFDRHASEPLWCTPPDCPEHEECVKCILDWLKSPVEPGEVENG